MTSDEDRDEARLAGPRRVDFSTDALARGPVHVNVYRADKRGDVPLGPWLDDDCPGEEGSEDRAWARAFLAASADVGVAFKEPRIFVNTECVWVEEPQMTRSRAMDVVDALAVRGGLGAGNVSADQHSHGKGLLMWEYADGHEKTPTSRHALSWLRGGAARVLQAVANAGPDDVVTFLGRTVMEVAAALGPLLVDFDDTSKPVVLALGPLVHDLDVPAPRPDAWSDPGGTLWAVVGCAEILPAETDSFDDDESETHLLATVARLRADGQWVAVWASGVDGATAANFTKLVQEVEDEVFAGSLACKSDSVTWLPPRLWGTTLPEGWAQPLPVVDDGPPRSCR